MQYLHSQASLSCHVTSVAQAQGFNAGLQEGDMLLDLLDKAQCVLVKHNKLAAASSWMTMSNFSLLRTPL